MNLKSIDKKYWYIGGGLLLLGIVGFISMKATKKDSKIAEALQQGGKKKDSVKKDSKITEVIESQRDSDEGGSDNFDPKRNAEIIHDALDWWTSDSDEEKIVEVLTFLNAKQRKATEDYFNGKWGKTDTMKDWMKDDLSTENWNKVKKLMNYK